MNTSVLAYGLWPLVVINVLVFILQWPTLLTLAMFPILVTMLCGWHAERNVMPRRSSARLMPAMRPAPLRSSRTYGASQLKHHLARERV